MTADGACLPIALPGNDFPCSLPGCFSVHPPEEAWSPLIVSSPHSGRSYPDDFLLQSRLDPQTLRRSEDCFVDEIFAAAPALGASLLAAEFPRAWCDANREKWELDPLMFEDRLPGWVNTKSPRVAAGLGTVARVVSTGAPIYHGKLRFADAENRVATCWEPYHKALAALVEAARARFSASLLLDCHSMPAHACENRGSPPDIVLGDLHGASCSAAITRHVEHFLLRRGYTVRRNDPYAGGFVTRRYGQPKNGSHALQIEIARGLYMREADLQRHEGIHRVIADMSALLVSLAKEAASLFAASAREPRPASTHVRWNW